ncbi:MAG: endonuclease/exonuclease/phosphatase family protein [Betaproteobacteria bacterium]|nr:endonuclease/exonuclease/phosphatase family protein [Betaproteobacteria bacterium]MDH5341713.1 endonuclease/exonuclease/phosphatase family protein [Betaproteobacteria bacterium]
MQSPETAAGAQRQLSVATYNIHKGFSFMPLLARRPVLHALREELRTLNPDLVFLQEVVGEHATHAARHRDWPVESQYEFLADSLWQSHAYGKNAVYDAGHHGNAMLSRYPITHWDNEDVSSHRFERRGLLHCEIAVPGWKDPLHCVCVHLALTARGRGLQLARLRQRIERLVPAGAPLIVAGDFNDWYWRHRATHELAHPLNMHEVFELFRGVPARSYPALLPVLRLDRIYVRGFTVRDARVHHGRRWGRVSDHAPLTAKLELARS